MWANIFLDEGPSYENQLSDDEDVVHAFELSFQESQAKQAYMDDFGQFSSDMEFPQIDEVEELAQAFEESSLSFTDLSSSTGGIELKWWKLFKEFNPDVHSSRTAFFWIKGSKQLKNIVCDVCEEQSPSVWFKCTYWGQSICGKHTSDGTPQCCTCSRFKMAGMKYITLSDGRKLCPDCRYTAVMDPEDCKPLLEEVHRFFKGLNMKIRHYIPILLVDGEEMTRIGHKGTEGLTTYEGHKLNEVNYVTRSIQKGENVEVVKEVEHLLPGRKVKSIMLLYGFPKVGLGTTLAHEMMHAWMRIQGYKRVDQQIAEGICEVVAHKWLEWQSFAGDEHLMTGTSEEAQFSRNLIEFLKDDIEIRHSKVYGHGFREAKWAVEKYGLRYTMEHIAHTGKLPE